MSAGSATHKARAGTLSLVFEPGCRPSADDLRRGLEANVGHAVPLVTSHPSAAGLLEIGAAGFTFVLSGLAPAAAATTPEIAHWYGFEARPGLAAAETIDVRPAQDPPDVLPQLRAMAGVACQLAGLAPVTAVVWQPARSAMAPAAFITAIGNWLRGGAFPALGLTALFRDDAGAIRSEGLAYFTGQEVHIVPQLGISTAQDAKIGARLINHLVGRDPIKNPFETMGPNGEQLAVEPPGSDGFLRIWRKS